MNLIIPMAGIGKRMRPHTLTVPKPLLPIAGKPIVQRLVEDIVKLYEGNIQNIVFIIGDFGKEVEGRLLNIAESLGAQGHIRYQEEALGTGHAVLCAEQFLDGNVIVAFADTLFKADFRIDASKDGIIWVKRVEDPSAFGVVKLNAEGTIVEFIEKPEKFVSDLAIIGIYFFKKGEILKNELQYLIDHNIREKGEYQLTNALENMKLKGLRFSVGQVEEWLDCGNKDVTVQTNGRYLDFIKNSDLIASSAKLHEAVIIPPVFVGENVHIARSVVGPYVSVGAGSIIQDSVVRNSIIGENTSLKGVHSQNSMVGNYVKIEKKPSDSSIGDYTVIFD